MKHYLSSGMGVNSVALHLLMIREGYDFEAVFVDHGGDWPETYEYLELFQKYLVGNGHKQITVLKPSGKYRTIIDYCNAYNYLPHMKTRWCSVKYKVEVCDKYYQKPCFQHIGFDAGEFHRAKIAMSDGIENRWLLIEYGIDRNGCKKIIDDAGLPIPMKSGCWFCPMQRQGQWKELRRKHPCLFQQAVDLEINNIRKAKEKGRKPFYLSQSKKPLDVIVNSAQMQIFEADEYPPCQCGL